MLHTVTKDFEAVKCYHY